MGGHFSLASGTLCQFLFDFFCEGIVLSANHDIRSLWSHALLDAFYKAVGDLNDDDRLTVMTVLKDIEENGRIQRETLNSLAEKHGWGFKQMRDHLYNDVFPEIAENLPASIAKAFKPAE